MTHHVYSRNYHEELVFGDKSCYDSQNLLNVFIMLASFFERSCEMLREPLRLRSFQISVIAPRTPHHCPNLLSHSLRSASNLLATQAVDRLSGMGSGTHLKELIAGSVYPADEYGIDGLVSAVRPTNPGEDVHERRYWERKKSSAYIGMPAVSASIVELCPQCDMNQPKA